MLRLCGGAEGWSRGSHVIKKNTIYCVTLSGVVGCVVLMSDRQTQLASTFLVVCSCISWTTEGLAGKSCANAAQVFSHLHFQTLWFITEMLPSCLMTLSMKCPTASTKCIVKSFLLKHLSPTSGRK